MIIGTNSSGTSGSPIKIPTTQGMSDVVTAANKNKIFKFTGTTTSTYTQGELYIIKEDN